MMLHIFDITTDDKNVQQSISLLQSKLEELTSLPSDEPRVIHGLMFQHRLPIAFAIRPIKLVQPKVI
jgi:hypothetical protein